jgi:hypothetical protein
MNYKQISLLLIILGLFALGVSLARAQGSLPPVQDGKQEQVSALSAAVSSRISYQGLLKENTIPVNGSRNMIFEIHDNNGCSSLRQSIQKSGVQLENGLFTTQLDISSPLMNGRALWIKVKVGDIALGCEEILPVPYAISFRPEARIVNSSSSYMLALDNTGSGDGLRAYSASPSKDYAAVWAVNNSNTGSGIAVYANSPNGYGVYAKSSSDLNPSIYAVNPNGKAGLFSGHVEVSASNGLFALEITNSGTGEGLRARANTSNGADWGAINGVNESTGSGIVGRSIEGYAGYMAGNLRVTGTCIGCSTAYIALNSGSVSLSPGDLVSVTGVAQPLMGNTIPVINVQRTPTAGYGTVFGVVYSAGKLLAGTPRDGVQVDDVIAAAGEAPPGGYVIIIVQGMVQVKVGDGKESICAGDRLTLQDTPSGLAVGSAGEEDWVSSFGQALETPRADQTLIWAMLDLR